MKSRAWNRDPGEEYFDELVDQEVRAPVGHGAWTKVFRELLKKRVV
jgi:hypothetical protein